MKILLHIGMPKAGSTALQQGLMAVRDALAERRVLYPVSPVIESTSNFLMAGLMPFDKLPRYVRHSLKPWKGDYQGLFDRWIDGIRAEVATLGAETLVLSGENLFAVTEAAPAAALRRILAGLGAERIEVVVYVRRPSDWYLSSVQQVLRASHQIRTARPVGYRAPIDCFAAHVADQIKVFAYDRARFPGGDILGHFLQAGLGIETPPASGEGERQFNATISAEAMALLQEYRSINHREADGTFTRDTARFRQALMQADAETGGERRPALHPDLAQRLDQGSPDLLWLRDAHGVGFDGIDYDRIQTEAWQHPARKVEDICVIDKRRKRKLLNRAILGLASVPRRQGAAD